jgi:hypothetical protein
MTSRLASLVVFSLAGLGLAGRVEAQAYCALRDPVRALNEFYPAASGYRSIVRTIGADAREAVGSALPFGLHLSELGKHTLYVAFDHDRPIGLVHVRSEKGEWGLVEIAWSLDLELKVKGFRFQRCRSASRAALEQGAFEEQLSGKGFDELRAMLSEDGQSLGTGKLTVPEGAELLAGTVLRSALKTILVTKEVWAADLAGLRGVKWVDPVPGRPREGEDKTLLVLLEPSWPWRAST